ncbi:MAG: Dabb family protein [Clostridia bacterium]|nr:Dabb family protein [Clostridia bacterium]
MIKHVVCFKLKDISDAERTKEVLLSMVGKVPQIRGISVNLDRLHSDRSYDVILEVLLDDWKALDSYQSDGYHRDEVKKYIHSVRSDSVALDYEV